MKNEVFAFMGMVWRKYSPGMHVENHEAGERILSLNLPQTYAVMKLLETARSASGSPIPSTALHVLQEAIEDTYQSSRQMFACLNRPEEKSSPCSRPHYGEQSSSFAEKLKERDGFLKEKSEMTPRPHRSQALSEPSCEGDNKKSILENEPHLLSGQSSATQFQSSLYAPPPSDDAVSQYEACSWEESIEKMALSYLRSGYNVSLNIQNDGEIIGLSAQRKAHNS